MSCLAVFPVVPEEVIRDGSLTITPTAWTSTNSGVGRSQKEANLTVEKADVIDILPPQVEA